MGLDVQIWEEKDFLPREDGTGEIEHGACDSSTESFTKSPHEVSFTLCLNVIVYHAVEIIATPSSHNMT